MTRERLYLYDTTLRDGAQTTGVDFSLDDKRTIAGLLDRVGVDYVEGGYPGANPLDTTFFSEKRTTKAKFTAFGMTKRAGRSASNDPGIAALIEAKADAVCFVAKASEYHVRVALETTTEENLAGIRESIEAAREKGIFVRGAMSCAVGCPYEGEIAPERVGMLAGLMKGIGVQHVGVADTIGVGTPVNAAPSVFIRVKRLAFHSLLQKFL